MIVISNIDDLPSVPAVYLMYEGTYVIYAGVTDKLKRRVKQHLILRNSSVTTGASSVRLNPEYIDKIEWWEYESFNDKIEREAAELIAFDFFEPVIRSRAKPKNKPKERYNDKDFQNKIRGLFSKEVSGRFKIGNLKTVLARVDELEKKINELGKISENEHEKWYEKPNINKHAKIH